MRFAYFSHVPWPEGADPGRIFAQVTEQCQAAEALGFESAWLAEHHFSRYSMGSSSLVLATHVAARTTRLRVGTAVLVSPLHNPIRLAEDTATLDQLSGGRLDVGFGRGAPGYEYGGFNLSHNESQQRFQDSIRVIQGLWTTPNFTFASQRFPCDQLNLVPPPLQQPHPPIYVAATRSPETLDFAVSTGHSLIIAVVQDTAEAIALCHGFVEKSQAAGFNVPLAGIPFFRYFYVAETMEQARRDTEAHLNWVIDIMQWRRFIRRGSEVHRRLADWRAARTEAPQSYDSLAQNRAIIGDPAYCAARVKELQAQGVGYFGCNFDFGGIPHKKVLRSMRLFAKEVMPALV